MSTAEVCMVAGMALVTFLIRYGLLPLSGRLSLPPTVERALSYSAPAVLTAIIVPTVLMPDGKEMVLSLSNSYLVGAVATAGVGWLTRNLLATIVLGMAAFLCWQWVVKNLLMF